MSSKNSLLLALMLISCVDFVSAITFNSKVRNLTVVAFREESLNGPVKLNISWFPSENVRRITSYSVLISTIPDSDKCHENSLYYTTNKKNQLQVVLPERRFFGFSSDISELSVIPGCSYIVQVYANPRTQLGEKGLTVTYTVPKCMTTKCCSNSSQSLSAPEVDAVVTKHGIIIVKWKIEENISEINAFIISFGTPLLKSKNGLSIFNKTIIHIASSTTDSFLWFPKEAGYDVLLNPENRIFVTAQDLNKCLSDEGSSTIISEAEKNFISLKVVLPVGIIGLSSLIIGLSILLRKYYFKNFNMLFLRKSQLSTIDIKNCKTEHYDSLLKNRNILYVEREIEEAMQKGNADKYEISFNRVKIISELGKGQFGKVFLASLQDDENVTVAVKMSLCSEPIYETEARQQLLEEIATIKTVGEHPNLVGLVGCCTLPERPVCLILEYMEGGDLLAYLQQLKSNAKTLENKDIVRFSVQIARGMEHLESKGIIHRDLAARNVLLSSDFTLKIADFGLSRNGVYIMGDGNGGIRRLPIRWMPPESVYDGAFSSKSDVWSFAVVLWEIGTLGNFPYSNMTDQQLLKYVLNGGRLDKPVSVSTELYNTMCLCWASRARDRPSFSQLLPHLEAMYESRYLFDGTSNPCCLVLLPAAAI